MSEMTQSTSGVPSLTLGWRLQMALRHGNVSVQQMADLLGVRRQSLSRWTGDHGAPPKRAYINQWALATGVSAEWLEKGIQPGSGPEGITERYPSSTASVAHLTGRPASRPRTGDSPPVRTRRRQLPAMAPCGRAA